MLTVTYFLVQTGETKARGGRGGLSVQTTDQEIDSEVKKEMKQSMENHKP